MRRANLEIEFGCPVNPKYCVPCCRAMPHQSQYQHPEERFKKSFFSRNPRTKNCELCGSSTCYKHMDKYFLKEKIKLCCDCSKLFTLDFMIDCIGPKGREHLRHVIDTYDRILLILKYSSQYIDECAIALKRSSKLSDKIGLGSNASGVISGVAGVAAAATIMTPAGPPLLIASIIFGSSANVWRTGDKTVNYYSSPNRLANKIIGLHTILSALLHVLIVLHETLSTGRIEIGHYQESPESELRMSIPKLTDTTSHVQNPKGGLFGIFKSKGKTPAEECDEKTPPFNNDKEKTQLKDVDSEPNNTSSDDEKNSPDKKGTGDIGSSSKKVKETTEHANFLSRTSTSGASLFNHATVFTTWAGGALGAVTIALEAKNMSSAIKRIRAGSPCNKAEYIIDVKGQLNDFPDSAALSAECEKYFNEAGKERRPLSI